MSELQGSKTASETQDSSSSTKPDAQSHSKLPSVFKQTELTPQTLTGYPRGCSRAHSSLSTQKLSVLFPLSYPGKQWHSNEPGVLKQVENAPQESAFSHSFMSIKFLLLRMKFNNQGSASKNRYQSECCIFRKAAF